MGFLTPILFRNDSYNSIKDNPEQVVRNILSAMREPDAMSFAIHSFRKPRWWQFWK